MRTAESGRKGIRGAGARMLVFASCLSVTTLAFADGPIVIRPGVPLLFAEDSVLESVSNMVRVVHRAQQDEKPVLVPDRPCEKGLIEPFGGIFPKDGGGYRMWYLTGGAMRTAVADSADGVSWTKPELGLSDYRGDGKRNNLVNVPRALLAVLDDAFEKDPARRYKAIGLHYVKDKKTDVVDMDKTGYYTFESADGLNWKECVRAASHYDTCALTQDPQTGDYLLYHKRYIPGYDGVFSRRQVFLTRSSDFRTWSEPVPVFRPDAVDDNWRTNAVQFADVYMMGVLAHAGGYIGFPAIFKRESIFANPDRANNQSGDDGHGHVEMAFSRDGVEWIRGQGRVPVIAPRGEDSIDRGGTFCVATCGPGSVVHTPTETWLYYGADAATHAEGWVNGRLCTIARAHWRRWGFVSMETWKFGDLVTKPVVFKTGKVAVNGKVCRPGEKWAKAEIEVVDAASGKVLARGEAYGDNTVKPVAWKGSVPVGRTVRLRIHSRYYGIYAIECF